MKRRTPTRSRAEEARRRRALPGRFAGQLERPDADEVTAAATPGMAAAFRAGQAKLVLVEDLDQSDDVFRPGLRPGTVLEPAPAPAAAPSGLVEAMFRGEVMAVDRDRLTDLEARATAGDRIVAGRQGEEDARFVAAAVTQGRITPARRQHFARLMAADRDATRELLASIPPNTVPLQELGHSIEGRDAAGLTLVTRGGAAASVGGLPDNITLLTPGERKRLAEQGGR